MREFVDRSFERHVAVVEAVRSALAEDVVSAAKLITTCLDQGGKLLICGNGGSAADAQHLAAEFSGRYLIKDRRPLPAVALTTDSSALTAIGNDFGFDSVFSRQFEALAKPGDVLLAISTSGNSPNVIKTLQVARDLGCPAVALTGGSGGRMRDLAEVSLVVPSEDTPHIQEMHITIGHILCDLVDRHFG